MRQVRWDTLSLSMRVRDALFIARRDPGWTPHHFWSRLASNSSKVDQGDASYRSDDTSRVTQAR